MTQTNAPETAEIRKIAENFQMRLTANHTAEPGKIWWASIQFPDVLGQVLAERVRLARLDEADRWKPEVCMEHQKLRSPFCGKCQRMARWEERIAELESAGTETTPHDT